MLFGGIDQQLNIRMRKKTKKPKNLNNKIRPVAGKMAWQLRALTDLTEDLDSVCSICKEAHNYLLL